MKASVRQQVLEKYGSKCGYCGCDIDIKTLQVDHIISKRFYFLKDGKVDHIDNYMPACYPCNHYKRTQSLKAFRYTISTLHKRLASLPKKTARPETIRRIKYLTVIAEKYGITPTQPHDGIFYFEKQQTT